MLRAGPKNHVNFVFSVGTILTSTVLLLLLFFFNTSTLQMLKLLLQTSKVIIFSVIYNRGKKSKSAFLYFTQVFIPDT